MKQLTVLVDADACPVKQEVITVCREMGARAVLVASYDHILGEFGGDVEIVQVDRADQSVDLYIANRLGKGDVLITQDFGLAALGLSRGAAVLSNRGQEYRPETIDFLLERRHESARKRRGGARSKGPRAFSGEDRQSFLHALTKVLLRLQENFSL